MVTLLVFGSGAALSIGVAVMLSRYVEEKHLQSLSPVLELREFGWLSVQADGQRVLLSGVAPDRFKHLAALSLVEAEVGLSRIDDRTTVLNTEEPEFADVSVGILQDGDAVRLFGDFPDNATHARLMSAIRTARPEAAIDDWSVLHDAEAGAAWARAIDFGLKTISLLPDANILLSKEAVTIEAGFESQIDLERTREALSAAKPQDLALDLRFSAPRPYQVPYLFDLHLEGGLARILSCYAESEDDRERVFAEFARRDLGTTGDCNIARGAPSENWTAAIAVSIDQLHSAGGGLLRIADFDVRIAPFDESAQARQIDGFDTLPNQYKVEFVGIDEFETRIDLSDRESVLSVQLNLDRTVAITGKLSDAASVKMVKAYAIAVLDPLELTVDVSPDAEPGSELARNALAGLDALTFLHFGSLALGADFLAITGSSSVPGASKTVSDLLAETLPGAEIIVEVNYDPAIQTGPTTMDARLCVSLATEIVEMHKITFEPGSDILTADVEPAMEQLVAVLQNCPDAPIEISGHTDSQGREQMNLLLSTRRARAVLDTLLNRGVLTRNYLAVGYGESQPIAENSTEEGRERNRRIEFRLRADNGMSLPQ